MTGHKKHLPLFVLFSGIWRQAGQPPRPLAPGSQKSQKSFKNMEQNNVSEKSISNCYSSRVLSMVFGHQVAKVCSGQRFLGSQGGIWSSGPARPGRPAPDLPILGPPRASVFSCPVSVFSCPGKKKHLIKIVLFSGIWRPAGQPPRAGQGPSVFSCPVSFFSCPGKKST